MFMRRNFTRALYNLSGIPTRLEVLRDVVIVLKFIVLFILKMGMVGTVSKRTSVYVINLFRIYFMRFINAVVTYMICSVHSAMKL